MTDASDHGANTSAPTKTKKVAGTKKTKKVSDHPKYADMVKEAIAALKERSGSSRHAILKYLVQNYKLGLEEKMINSHLKMALRAGLKNGSLKQSKGMGAAGSFKLNEGKAIVTKSPRKKSSSKSPVKKAMASTMAPKPASPKKKAPPKPKKAAATAKAKVASPVKKVVAAKPKKAVAKPKAPTIKKAASPKKAKSASPKKAKAASPKKSKAGTKAKKVTKK